MTYCCCDTAQSTGYRTHCELWLNMEDVPAVILYLEAVRVYSSLLMRCVFIRFVYTFVCSARIEVHVHSRNLLCSTRKAAAHISPISKTTLVLFSCVRRKFASPRKCRSAERIPIKQDIRGHTKHHMYKGQRDNVLHYSSHPSSILPLSPLQTDRVFH